MFPQKLLGGRRGGVGFGKRRRERGGGALQHHQPPSSIINFQSRVSPAFRFVPALGPALPCSIGTLRSLTQVCRPNPMLKLNSEENFAGVSASFQLLALTCLAQLAPCYFSISEIILSLFNCGS